MEISTQTLDHHGLVAAKCQDLRLSERIDKRLSGQTRRIVSHGTACVAMILNGLGFNNRRLYLTPQFFENKPVEALLGPGIEARHLNDDALGDALDAIAAYGPSRLFGEVAFEVALEHNLLDDLTHVDTTSFSVHGQYTQQDTATGSTEEKEAQSITVTHGHSKAHRPDLKQVVLSLAVAGKSGVPLWMAPCDGNASDKAVLPETIERMHAFRQTIDTRASWRWVADSALYTADNLKKIEHTVWVSRVPETIVQAKALVRQSEAEIEWTASDNGYRYAAFESDYAGIAQRWLLVSSDQAYRREVVTFNKKLGKQEEALHKSMAKFSAEVFACETDADKAFRQHQKANPLFVLTATVVAIEKYAKAGRPKQNDEKQCVGYQVQVEVERHEQAIEQQRQTKGRFILATNDTDASAYPDARLLADYKAQQTVEQGFRFLKNPEFMADTLFLKSPKRIAALMMVMTLCLMVYNLTQFQMRERLEATGQTLPNQLGKPSDKPTLRWVFQLMEGITLVHISEPLTLMKQSFVSNLSALRNQIIRLFGQSACHIYRITTESGGM